MTESRPDAVIESLWYWPVKGFSGQQLPAMPLSAHAPFVHDRLWAIERAGAVFDPANPRHVPKGKFFQLVNTPQLARLHSTYDPDTTRFTLHENGREMASGQLDSRAGRTAIEDFLASWLGDLAPHHPRVVGIGSHHFFDVPRPWVSLVNLATLRDMQPHAGAPLAAQKQRFRANIYVDGLPPWQELEWEGRTILLNGTPAFIARERIGRCVATEVNPESGERDAVIPRMMLTTYGHKDCGLYLEPVADITLAPGDVLSVA